MLPKYFDGDVSYKYTLLPNRVAESQTIKRNGKSYQFLGTYQKDYSSNSSRRIWIGVRAFAKTLFSLGLGLLSEKIWDDWKVFYSGKRIVRIYQLIPEKAPSVELEKQGQSSSSVQPVASIELNKQVQDQSNSFDSFEQQLKILRGPSEKEIAFPGYEQEKLEEIQTEIEKRGLPLQVCPKRPEQSYAMNLEVAKKWVNGVKDEYRAVAQKAIDKVQYISMETFDGVLKECIENLNQKLNEQGQPKFSVGIVCGKSNQWVTSLALKSLAYLPSSWFSMGSHQGTISVKVPKAKFDMNHVQEETIVLFDDCSYSGNQLGENLARIGAHQKEKNKKVNIYVVIPFMSTQATKIAKNFEKHFNMHLITSSETIKTVPEIFTPEEVQQLDYLTEGQFSAVKSRTLCYTDWRYPDGTSFVQGFGRKGMLLKNIITRDENGEIESERRLRLREEFIPQDIPRPYEIKNA